jgi:hypothetical protein
MSRVEVRDFLLGSLAGAVMAAGEGDLLSSAASP